MGEAAPGAGRGDRGLGDDGSGLAAAELDQAQGAAAGGGALPGPGFRLPGFGLPVFGFRADRLVPLRARRVLPAGPRPPPEQFRGLDATEEAGNGGSLVEGSGLQPPPVGRLAGTPC